MKLAPRSKCSPTDRCKWCQFSQKQASKGRFIAPEPMNFVLKNGRIQSTALVMQATALDLVRADRIKICRPSAARELVSGISSPDLPS